MNHQGRVLFLVFCIINLFSLTLQYGEVYVDEVYPAVSDQSYIIDVTSSEAYVGDINVNTLSISHPEGLRAEVPGSLSFGGSSHDLVGDLGVSLGGANTQSIEFNSNEAFTSLSQTFGITADQANIRSEDDTTIQSTRGVKMTSNYFNLDGLFGVGISSTEENVVISSGLQISTYSQNLDVSSTELLHIQAISGSIYFQSTTDVSMTSTNVFVEGFEAVQFVANGTFSVSAEDSLQFDSATSKFSALNGTSFTSTQNVDFTASDSLLFHAQGDATISSGNDFFLFSFGQERDSSSNIALTSADAISLTSELTTTIRALNGEFNAVQQQITADALDITAASTISVGSDASNSVYITSTNEIDFFIEAASAEFPPQGELSLSSYFNTFKATNWTLVHGDDVKVVASNIDFESDEIVFFGDTIEAFSLSNTGRSVYTSQAGMNLTAGISFWVNSRDNVITAVDTLTYDIDRTTLSNFHEEFNVQSDGNINLNTFQYLGASQNFEYNSDNDDINFLSGAFTFQSQRGEVSLNAANNGVFNSLNLDLTAAKDLTFNSLDTMIFTAKQTLSFNSVKSAINFNVYDDYSVTAATTISFNTLLDAGSPEVHTSAFVSNGDLELSTGTFTVTKAEDVLFLSGYTMYLDSNTDPVSLQATNIEFATLNHQPFSGIYFYADSTITFSSLKGNFQFDAAGDLNINTLTASITGTDIAFNSIISYTLQASASNFTDSSFLADSSGFLAIASEGTVTLTAGSGNQTISFTSGQDMYITGGDFDITSFSFQYNGNVVDFLTTSSITLTQSTFSLTASYPGATLTFGANQGDIDITSGNSVYNVVNDFALTAGGDLFTFSDEDVVLNANTINIMSREITYTTNGDFSLQANDIELGTDVFLSHFTATSDDLSYYAVNRVIFTSEGNINWFVDTGITTVTTPALHLQGSNSEGFIANGGIITFSAPKGSENIEIYSGSGTIFQTTDDVTIHSDNDMLWKAQRSLYFHTNTNGMYLFAEEGNFEVTSAANINYEASDAVSLHAYNRDGTASASFLADNGMLLHSSRNGIYFKSEGIVPESQSDNYDGIYIQSTGYHGDVSFTSEEGEIRIIGPYQISFTSDAQMSLLSAYNSTYTARYHMDFNALNGGFNFDAVTKINMTAGTPGNPADLIFLQPKDFYAIAQSTIYLHSEGPVAGNAIEVTGLGSILFTTSDASDIRSTATNAQTFTGDKSFVIESNEDIQALSPEGSIIFNAVTLGEFITEGGPIQLKTQTGSNNGEILLLALNQNISFTSGNSAFYTAKNEIDLTAATDIAFTADDGYFEVQANSATSVIYANATGYMRIQSTGTRQTPYDGIYVEAANNVEMGVIGTDTISFNTVNYFTIGEISRPIITINAGGNASTEGITITSDGSINAATENTLKFDITGELLYAGTTFMTAYSNGPFTIQSTGTSGLGEDITFSAATGVMTLEGDNLVLSGNNGITTTTSGVLEISQLGTAAYNKILINGPLVNFAADAHMTWVNRIVDIDVNDTFSVFTKGDGTFEGKNSHRSTMLLKASTDISVSSGDRLTIENTRDFGATRFITSGSGSTISIQSDTESDIEIQSGKNIEMYGVSTSFTTGDRISFSAQDLTASNDDENGDISFYASSDISVSSQSDVTVSAVKNVQILSTLLDNEGEGYDVTFVSSDETVLVAELGIVIANTYNEGGDITFEALSEITIENSETTASNADKIISFSADGEFDIASSRDTIINGASTPASFNAEINGDITITADGIDPVDDFGIQFDNDNGNLDFRSIFGSIQINADDNINIKGTNSSQSKLVFDGKRDTISVSQGATTLSSTTFSSISEISSQNFYGEDNIIISTRNLGAEIGIYADGFDENALYAIRFDSVFPIVLNVAASTLDFTVAQDFLIRSDNSLIIEAFHDLSFIIEHGDVLIEANRNITFFSGANPHEAAFQDITADNHINMFAGSYHAESDGDIFFNADLGLEVITAGTDADIFFFSSGSISWEAAGYFHARTSELNGANINITSTLGRIEFHSTEDTLDIISLFIYSSFGPMVVSSENDDGDIYFYSPVMDVQADGDINILSTLDVPDKTYSGVTIDVNTINAFSSFLEFSGNTITFDSTDDYTITNTGYYNAETQYYPGGRLSMISTSDTRFFSNDDVTFRTYGQGSDLYVISQFGDIQFTTNYIPNGITERTVTGLIGGGSVVDIIDNSVMKIPEHNFPGAFKSYYTSFGAQYGPNRCRVGEIFYTSVFNANRVHDTRPTTTSGWLCHCSSGQVLRCMELRERPCQDSVYCFLDDYN